jgi:MFS family permease
VTGLSSRWPLVCFAALGSFWGAWAALMPDLKAQVGATDAELGLALLFAGIGAIPAMLIAGRLWPRLGWWMLPICGLIFALTIVGPIFATTPLTLALFGALAGAGSGALDVSMNAAVSDVEAERGTRLMFGAHAMFSLAVLLSAVATGLARQAGAAPAPVLVIVALFVAVVAIGSIGTARVAKRAATTAEETGSGSSIPGLGGLAFLAALCAAAFLVEDAVQNWSALHIEGGLGASPALGGAAPGVFAGAMFLGRMFGQRFGDRFSERMLLSGGALVSAAGTAVLAAAPTPLIALIGLFFAGAGISTVAPALFARAGRLASPAGRAAAIARVTTIGYTGFIVGPALVGFIAEATTLSVAIGTLALLALLVAVGGWAVMRGDESPQATFEEGEELLRTSRG